MSEKVASDRPSRLHRIASVIASGGYSLRLFKTPEEKREEPWRPESMTQEEYERWELRSEARDYLGKVALTDPLLGKAIFDALRTSDDPRYRITAATMVPKLFHDEEMESDESVLELKQDDDYEVRDSIGLALLFGSDLD